MAIPFEDSINRTTNAPKWTDEKVADLTARDAILSTLRYEGMLVFCVADKKSYQLQGGITNLDWIEFGANSPVPNLLSDTFTATAGQTAFTLTADPINKNNIIVLIDGVIQLLASYSLSGLIVTLDEGALLGSIVEFRYGAALVINTPANLSVTQGKLALRGASSTSAVGIGGIIKTATVSTSNATGSFTTAVTTPAITTNGRPVRIECQPDGTTTGSLVETLSTGDTPQAEVRLLRGVSGVYTEIARWSLGGSFTGVVGSDMFYPPGSFNHTDTDVAAGTYTYRYEISGGAGTTISWSRIKTVVYEH